MRANRIERDFRIATVSAACVVLLGMLVGGVVAASATIVPWVVGGLLVAVTLPLAGHTVGSRDNYQPDEPRLVRPALILLAAALFSMNSEIVRVLAGWPVQPASSNAQPAVVSPGDSVVLQLPAVAEKSLYGKWRTLEVRLDHVEPSQPPDADLALHGLGEDWAEMIESPKERPDAEERAFRPAFTVRVPDDVQVFDDAGATMRLTVSMHVEYPVNVGPQLYAEHSTWSSATFDVRVAPPGAGIAWRVGWWVGLVLPLFVFLWVGGNAATAWRQHRNPKNTWQSLATAGT
ncbi:MAG: hypothetical protein AB7K09_25295 [Planctomycetota bacterium]